MQGAASVHLDSEFIQNPHTLYGTLRREAPVREVIMPRGLKVWLVTRYADVRDALADSSLHKDMRKAQHLIERHSTHGTSARSGQELAAHMMNADPPDHTRLRRLVSAAFTVRRVEQMRPRIEEITENLLANLADRDKVDLLEDFAIPLPSTVIGELLGVPPHDHDEFRRWTIELVSGLSPEAVAKAAQDMAAYLAKLIADKRANPADDLLTALIQVRDEDGDGDRLTEPELVAMAFLLLAAGYETTVNLIGNGMLALLSNPDQFAALKADPSLLPSAIEEFLRYDGPVNLATLRYTVAPIRLGDVDIPEGEFVLVSLSAANRDDERFPDGDRLDITRSSSGHLAFGHGAHFCVGAQLARFEGQIAIGRLLERFPNMALAAEPGDIKWRNSEHLRGLESLPVRLR
jgi:cytochrome P450